MAHDPADLRTELERFNDYRRELLQGVPLTPEKRLPGAYTGVGGDVGDADDAP